MKIYMAPLEEVTEYIYRNAYHAFFSPMDKYFAPFIAAKQNKGRLFNYKEKKNILPENNQGLYLVPQILTNGQGNPDRCAMTLIMFLNSHLKSKNYGMAGALSVYLFIVSGILCFIVYRMTNDNDPDGSKAAARRKRKEERRRRG